MIPAPMSEDDNSWILPPSKQSISNIDVGVPLALESEIIPFNMEDSILNRVF